MIWGSRIYNIELRNATAEYCNIKCGLKNGSILPQKLPSFLTVSNVKGWNSKTLVNYHILDKTTEVLEILDFSIPSPKLIFKMTFSSFCVCCLYFCSKLITTVNHFYELSLIMLLSCLFLYLIVQLWIPKVDCILLYWWRFC